MPHKVRVKYKTDGITCLTECECQTGLKIGSYGCYKCRFFKSVNNSKGTVICTHPGQKGDPV